MVKFDEEIFEPLSPSSEIEDQEFEAEDISYDDLKKRMWKDRMHMQKLKAQRPIPEPDPQAKEDISKRKKMARAQDSILKYMVKIMEVCNAQGFVYGIVPEKGKTVTGSSDSLREWWKDKVSEKRKCVFVPEAREDTLFACQNFLCPESDVCSGFVDKNSRTQHEKLCTYRPADENISGLDLQIYENEFSPDHPESIVSYEQQHQSDNIAEIVQEVNRTLELPIFYSGHNNEVDFLPNQETMVSNGRQLQELDWMDLVLPENEANIAEVVQELNKNVDYRNYLIGISENTMDLNLNISPLEEALRSSTQLNTPSVWDLAYIDEEQS
ncbi:hypothetical protein M9H77_19763 [Catharanthus roseus]|uniref:Uncharacterized protein n=1 Tax=Catharanthus roseus TaxID=4058 RepID=A0ACC0BBB0_CATRO|nr:hypothetical protein M9H77_19763 [Catharanthus roseus]